jgi:hypothetical protein
LAITSILPKPFARWKNITFYFVTNDYLQCTVSFFKPAQCSILKQVCRAYIYVQDWLLQIIYKISLLLMISYCSGTLSYITNLVCYAYFHWLFNPECQDGALSWFEKWYSTLQVVISYKIKCWLPVSLDCPFLIPLRDSLTFTFRKIYT